MRNAIEIHALTKRYGILTALDEVSFEVGRGELFGLIGPDGAGKTTLFRLLATLVAPDGGTASVDGLDIVADYKRIRERVGYMPGRFSLYPDLSVGENLAFFAALFGVEIAENYDLVAPIYRQIEPFRARRAGKLSGGMKQKLALCCALIHRPAVLLLDEPTTGVDAVSRSEFWDMLSELKGKGISMLVSTPYMDEAVRCDRVALCDGGKILAVDTPQGAIFLCRLPERQQADLTAGTLLLDGIQDPGNLGTMLRTADALGVPIALLDGCADPYSFKTVRASMGAVFRMDIPAITEAEVLAQCAEKNLMLTVTALNDRAVDIRGADFRNAVAVIGSEGQGVRQSLLEAAAQSVIIPMQAHCESLNAAIAAAIVMWQMKNGEYGG